MDAGAAFHAGSAPDSLGTMQVTPDDINHITRATLDYYEQHAAQFFEGTREHDVSQNIAALLDAIEGQGFCRKPYTILDLGCGPGRDLKSFAALGHTAVGLDGSARFAEMARAYSGCEVWQQDFAKLDLPPARFDGVFANAALFHIPSLALARVLDQLYATLKPGGILFSSNPHGQNEEGWNGPRYGSYYDYVTWERFMTAAGFDPLGHFYRPPGLPRAEQAWLASVWRKSAPGAPA
jgi:SAM-dependent methyltransferase